MSASMPTVAILNAEPAVIELFELLLGDDGYRTVVESSEAAPARLAAFVANHDPAVVLYDVPPPYAVNWQRLAALRAALPAHAPRFIVTTTGLASDGATADGGGVPVITLPFDVEGLLTAVREATRRLQQQAEVAARNLRLSHDTIDRAHQLLRDVSRRPNLDQSPHAFPDL